MNIEINEGYIYNVETVDDVVNVTVTEDVVNIVEVLMGERGLTGLQGVQGVPGVGVPSSGLTGQVLSKISDDNYDTGWVDVSSVTNFELELGRKSTGDSYMEYTSTGSDITTVEYWTDSTKVTKLFTKNMTYTSGNPTLIVITDEQTSSVLTTTIAYVGDIITSVTKVIT